MVSSPTLDLGVQNIHVAYAKKPVNWEQLHVMNVINDYIKLALVCHELNAADYVTVTIDGIQSDQPQSTIRIR